MCVGYDNPFPDPQQTGGEPMRIDLRLLIIICAETLGP